MQASESPAYTWHDAWVLLAIAIADSGSGAELRAILSAGDYINHAIFTGPELRHSVARLIRAGCLQEQGGRFALIGPARDFWLAQANTRKAVLRRLDEFQDFLNSPATANTPQVQQDTNSALAFLSDEALLQAYQAYWQGYSAAPQSKKRRKI